MRILLAVTLALAVGGCEIIAQFEHQRTAELTDDLCNDGLDNDEDGLTDCQDFHCIGVPACCKAPLVIVDAPLTGVCNIIADHDSTWLAWPAAADTDEERPELCPTGFSPNKLEQCYEVGLLSRASAPLQPGVHVEAQVTGIPEIGGRLEIALTRKDVIQVPRPYSACGPFEGAGELVALSVVRSVSDAPAAHLVAQLDGADVGWSDDFSESRKIAIDVEADGTVQFSLGTATNMTPFYRSPANEPLPSAAGDVHLVVAGVGKTATLSGVRFSSGTQCEAPGSWRPAASDGAPLRIVPNGSSIPLAQVANPAALVDITGVLRLFFSGCGAVSGDTACQSGAHIGWVAVASHSALEENDLHDYYGRVAIDVGVVAGDPDAAAGWPFFYTQDLGSGSARGIYPMDASGKIGNYILPVGTESTTGSGWDADDLCCATGVLAGGNTPHLLLYYAGRSRIDHFMRIGLVESNDGVHFDRHDDPVLDVGAAGEFDERGVSDPTVAYDTERHMYLMWYSARAFLGADTIGYAVSVDGIHWKKYPGNPVVTPSALNVQQVGAPSVILQPNNAQRILFVHGQPMGTAGLQTYQLLNDGQPVTKAP